MQYEKLSHTERGGHAMKAVDLFIGIGILAALVMGGPVAFPKEKQNKEVPNRIGYTVHLVNESGVKVGEVSVPFHDLRRENRDAAKSLSAEYLLSVQNAVETWGRLNGKTEEWIRTNRASLYVGGTLSYSFECGALDQRMIMPECGSGSPVGGGSCGKIVCASTIRKGGKVSGCGGGCGDCSIVTVCG